MGLFSDPNEYCNESDEIWSDEVVGELEMHDYAWIASGIATFFSCALSFYLIWQHCRNYTCKQQQRHIIRILLMVPIYSIDSFLSFRFYNYSIYFDLVRDCYEAFIINTFFCLLIEYTGGYQKTKEAISKYETVKLVFPLNCWTVRPKRGLLRMLKRITLQYVIIRPLCTVIAAILHSQHLYCPGNYVPVRGYFYITIAIFFSVTAAMYALIMFYSVTKDDMAHVNPFGKFLAVKAVIFLSFWQSIVVAGLVYINVIRATSGWTTNNISEGVQNVLICGEMLVAAIAHIWVFTYQPYVKEGVRTPVIRTFFRHAFNPLDIGRDVKYSFFPKWNILNRKEKKHHKLSELDSNGAGKASTNSSPASTPSSSPALPAPAAGPPLSPSQKKKKGYKSQVDLV